MADSQVIDQRNKSIIQAHSELAKVALDQESAKIIKILEGRKDRVELLTPKMQEATSSEQQFAYHAMLDFGGFLYAVVEVTFYDWNNRSKRVGHFFGHSGGLVVGAGVTWGTVWLNFPIEKIFNWEARFQANFIPTTTNVNWWGMAGEPIGSFVGGGLSVGVGIVGGQGKFD